MATKNTTTKNLYFVTTTVVNWVDIFSRPKYKHIIIESLAFLSEDQGIGNIRLGTDAQSFTFHYRG